MSAMPLLERAGCNATRAKHILLRSSAPNLERSRIAHHENFWMPRHGEITLHLDPSRAIGLHRQPFPGGRWGHASRPDHRLARDPVACHNDSIVVDPIDGVAQPHLDTQPAG